MAPKLFAGDFFNTIGAKRTFSAALRALSLSFGAMKNARKKVASPISLTVRS
jgi:hypothetical protein